MLRFASCVALLVLAAPIAHAEKAIWDWAFVTVVDGQLVGHRGTSLFEVKGSSFSGPLHADKVTMEIDFAVDASHVQGSFKARGSRDAALELTGDVTWRRSTESPCIKVVSMRNGENYVALESALQGCPNSTTEQNR
jgi:hypothetical protein